jgi:hypothetical protein
MSIAEHVAGKLTEALNRHGHAFQHRLLKEAEDNYEAVISRTWLFEASELPVESNGQGTRIDFVLMSRRTPMYLVCECKRSNPAISNWCFAKAPYVSRDVTPNGFIVEHCRMEADNCVSTGAMLRYLHDAAYSIALPVHSDHKGDDRGGKDDAIEIAATQVCRGLNGLANTFSHKTTLFANKQRAILVPVVFTTAALWVSDVSLKDADIRTGCLRPEQVQVREVEWLYYQYHQSPGLKHSVGRPYQGLHSSLSSWMEADSIRTIVVVNASASKKFLATFGDDMHGMSPL